MSLSAPIRVLVAEDDPLFSELVDKLLQPLITARPNSAVTFVSSLDAVITAVAELPPHDVILLDLNMPPNGMAQTLAHLDELEEHTAVIILTGSKEAAVRKIIGDRPTPILEKDMVVRNPGLLDQAIRKIVELYQTRRHARVRENIRIMKGAQHATEG